jgi:hypothetical protein
MVSYTTQQQHSLSTIQAKKEPVKAVPNLLPNQSDVSWNDHRGLHWTLFEEGKQHD